MHLFDVVHLAETFIMPGKGKTKASRSGTKRHYKVKQQKKRFIRSKDPLLSVFMWGIQHSVSQCVYCRIFFSTIIIIKLLYEA